MSGEPLSDAERAERALAQLFPEPEPVQHPEQPQAEPEPADSTDVDLIAEPDDAQLRWVEREVVVAAGRAITDRQAERAASATVYADPVLGGSLVHYVSYRGNHVALIRVTPRGRAIRLRRHVRETLAAIGVEWTSNGPQKRNR